MVTNAFCLLNWTVDVALGHKSCFPLLFSGWDQRYVNRREPSMERWDNTMGRERALLGNVTVGGSTISSFSGRSARKWVFDCNWRLLRTQKSSRDCHDGTARFRPSTCQVPRESLEFIRITSLRIDVKFTCYR